LTGTHFVLYKEQAFDIGNNFGLNHAPCFKKSACC
jgi:hypothetical protein